MATGRQLAIQPSDESAHAAETKEAGLGSKMSDAILSIVANVPDSTEPVSTAPEAQARIIAERAARMAAGISGTAAMAPGPLGMLTLLPDLVAVWRVQVRSQ